MFNKILFTFITKFLSSAIGFLIVIITARILGAEGRGEISLIVLGCTIALLVSNIVGGSGMLILVPASDPFNLLIPSWIWAIISSAGVAYLLTSLELIPGKYSYHVFGISLIQCLASVNMTMLMGKQNIKLFNILGIFQVLILFIVLSTFIFILNQNHIMIYVYALYISFSIQAFLSFWFLLKKISFDNTSGITSVVKTILSLGLIIQLTNLIQIINYRVSFYFIENKLGLAALGIFTVAGIFAESVWLFSRSITMVQFTGIINSTNHVYKRNMTIRMAKLSLAGSILVYIPLIILPPSFYTFVFGNEFESVANQIIWLGPGILALSFSTVFAHYFAALGKNKLNLFASMWGLAASVSTVVVLIPRYGLIGAAAGISLSYIVTATYLFFNFSTFIDLKVKELIPVKEDFLFLKNEFFKGFKTE